MVNFEGKVAVVTGGTSGIGKAIAEALVEAGAKVAIGARSEDKLKEMQDEHGDNLIGVKTDVTKSDDVENLVKSAVDKFGKLDVAFNVAGASKSGKIGDISEEDWMFTVELDLKGVFLSMKHEINAMKQDGGAIVNVSSLNSEVPMWGGSAYASAKAGVSMLTKNAVLEYTDDGIRFNALLPGLVDTPLTKSFNDAPDIKEAFMERIPMKRAADPKEMAKAALFLASDDASYVTGATLIADGGWSTTGYPDLSKFMD